MDFRKILEELSEDCNIPLCTHKGNLQTSVEMRGQGYNVHYSTYPDPGLKPLITYVGNKSDSDFAFVFGAKEDLPLNLSYTIRASFLMNRLDFFRRMENKVGALFLDAFLGAEYEPSTEMFQAPTWKEPREIESIHNRCLVIPETELFPFIKEHIKSS